MDCINEDSCEGGKQVWEEEMVEEVKGFRETDAEAKIMMRREGVELVVF